MTELHDMTGFTQSIDVKVEDYITILKIPKLYTYILIYFICIFQEVTFITFIGFLDSISIPIYTAISYDSPGWVYTGLFTYIL